MPDDERILEIEKGLSAFFYADEIEWKIQSYNTKEKKDATSALIVPYIKARAIMT